jgi:hypothetical protein
LVKYLGEEGSVMKYRVIKLGAPLLASLLFFTVTGKTALAQGQAKRCSFCARVACSNEFSGVCDAGAVKSCCDRGAQDEYGWYPDCRSDICSSCSSGQTAQDCIKKLLAARFDPSQVPDQDNDDTIRDHLLAIGASATKVIPQPAAPVYLLSALHNTHDLVKSATIINMSQKSVVAVRIGYTIKNPNSTQEMKVAAWNKLPAPLALHAEAVLPAQKISSKPLGIPGTIINFYIADVLFQDGSSWHYTSATPAKPSTNSFSFSRTLEKPLSRTVGLGLN